MLCRSIIKRISGRDDSMNDHAANLATVVGTIVAVLTFAGALWSYIRRGHKLSIEIIWPRDNRHNRKPTDRIITVSVSNHGSEAALISKLRLRTIKSRMVVARTVTNEALFDDTTPWQPAYKLLPGDVQTYNLQFFEGWTKADNPTEGVEIAVFIRGSTKPRIASFWP
jgi:hypothetical protein